MFVFQRETAGEIRGAIEKLLPLHFEEVSFFEDLAMAPDYALYEMAEAMGTLRIYTARRERELRGYAIFFVRAHPHYQYSIHAFQALLFIHPEHRGFGMRFLAWCDAQLKAEGVEYTHHTVTIKKDFSKMLERLGYEPFEKIYVRRL